MKKTLCEFKSQKSSLKISEEPRIHKPDGENVLNGHSFEFYWYESQLQICALLLQLEALPEIIALADGSSR